MFLKKCDMISPPITLFFKGESIHSSIFSGILTIAVYIVVFVFSVIYLQEFINKTNPTAYFFNRFVKDAGEFTLDHSSMFHYVYTINKISQTISKFDLDMFRIIGLEQINVDVYYSSVDLNVTPHWLYGICDINDSNTKSLDHLIPIEENDNSACIRKYYNPATRKYYDITDNKNFKWPSIAHGMSNPNYTFYGLIVEKCRNDDLRKLSGLGPCKSKEEIDNYILSSGIVLEFVDHYPDVLNYKEPFSKYFYTVSNLLYPKSFTVNHINFNPALIKTHNGIFFDNIIEERSYLFDQNEKVSMDEEIEMKDNNGNPVYDENGNKMYRSTGIVSSFYFWMQNRLQYYERNYKRLQDILGNIGGLSRTIFIAAGIINILVNKYIILLDTEELALSLGNKNCNDKINNQAPITIYNNNNDILYPPRRLYYDRQNYIQQTPNKEPISKENILLNTYSGNEKSSNKNYMNIKINNLINNYNNTNNNEISQGGNSEKETQKNLVKKMKYRRKRIQPKFKNSKFKENNNDKEKDKDLDKKTIKNIIIENNANDNRPNQKQNFNFVRYIWFNICCRRNNPNILYYEDYREKILSEENIIKGYIDISNLIKLNKLDVQKDIEDNINNISHKII